MLAEWGSDDRVRARTRVTLENWHATCYFQVNETEKKMEKDRCTTMNRRVWDEMEAARGRSVQITCLSPSYLTSSTPVPPHSSFPPSARPANWAARRVDVPSDLDAYVADQTLTCGAWALELRLWTSCHTLQHPVRSIQRSDNDGCARDLS